MAEQLELLLFWLTTGAYAVAWVQFLLGWKNESEAWRLAATKVLWAGFAFHVLLIGQRWVRAGHVPFLSAFEFVTFFSFLIVAVFYFVLIRPQQRRAREHRTMLQNLKKGDLIVTSGGLVGKISGLTDQIVTLEVAEKIRLRVMRSHIASKQTGDSPSSGNK